MNKKKHQKEVDKLGILEEKLIELIADTDNSDLMDLFTKWQDQRIICNEGYLKWLESYASEAPTQISDEEIEKCAKGYFAGAMPGAEREGAEISWSQGAKWMRDQLSKAREPKEEWISVEDEHPEPEGEDHGFIKCFICQDNGHVKEGMYNTRTEKFQNKDFTKLINEVTHWQPLSKPPVTQQER